MRNIVVTNNISLDGVMQAPGRADEDTRDGFSRGGWAVGFSDEVMGRKMGEGMATSSAILLGRRTYEDFASFWPRQTGNPFNEVLTNAQKYVVSETLASPSWENTMVLPDVEAVATLKQEGEGDIVILGSGALIGSLHAVIDRWILLIHPLALGAGRRLFNAPLDLELVDSVTTTTGVIIATYQPR